MPASFTCLFKKSTEFLQKGYRSCDSSQYRSNQRKALPSLAALWPCCCTMREWAVISIMMAAGTRHIYNGVTAHWYSLPPLQRKLKLRVLSDGTQLPKPQSSCFILELLIITHILKRFKWKSTYLLAWTGRADRLCSVHLTPAALTPHRMVTPKEWPHHKEEQIWRRPIWVDILTPIWALEACWDVKWLARLQRYQAASRPSVSSFKALRSTAVFHPLPSQALLFHSQDWNLHSYEW